MDDRISFLCFLSQLLLCASVWNPAWPTSYFRLSLCVMQFIMQYFFFLRLKQRKLVCQLVEDQQSLTSNEETQSTRIFPKVKKNLFDTHVDFVAGVFLVKRCRCVKRWIGFSLCYGLFVLTIVIIILVFLRNHVTVCRLIVGSWRSCVWGRSFV